MGNNLCFVLMPFGKKPVGPDLYIDFDEVYHKMIAPAVKDAGLEPIRADEELVGGIIHKPMFERLILCDYAVADLTAANANVFYELGIRHAVRPWRTVPIFAQGCRLPFDVQMLRGLPYALHKQGTLADPTCSQQQLLKRLEAAQREAVNPSVDSPVYQLVHYMVQPEIDHTKTDVFRDQVRYAQDIKHQLAKARKEGSAAIEALQNSLKPLPALESGVIIDLLLSYRAVKAWDRMIQLVEDMPQELRTTVMIQEQFALALNRADQGERAEEVLKHLLEEQGPSSETLGILGRVYKDRWEKARQARETFKEKALLENAMNTYLQGFEADWRDAYPGINAVTMMELQDPPDARRIELIPIVRYAVNRKIASGNADYWDYATLLELAVLEKDERKAGETLGQALTHIREVWEPETTARNLRLIRETREQRQDTVPWAKALEDELEKQAKK